MSEAVAGLFGTTSGAVGKRTRGARRGRLIAWLLAPLIAAAGYMAYLGYFGGPLYEDMPAAPSGPVRVSLAAVIFSGDMGFHVGMGPEVARHLTGKGISVVGVNSLTFFRTRRTQRETAALIEQAVGHAMRVGRSDRVILIGQSFGADMLQSGAALLPPSVRARVALLVLVVPGETISYRASPSNLFALPGDEVDGIPTGRLLGWAPTLCIYGIEEQDSLCPHLRQASVRRIGLPGGHPLHHDPAALHAVLDRAIGAIGGTG
jgi:type IV secretory pathway VirJ component